MEKEWLNRWWSLVALIASCTSSCLWIVTLDALDATAKFCLIFSHETIAKRVLIKNIQLRMFFSLYDFYSFIAICHIY